MGRVRTLPKPAGRADGRIESRPVGGIRYRPRSCPRGAGRRRDVMGSAPGRRRPWDRGIADGERCPGGHCRQAVPTGAGRLDRAAQPKGRWPPLQQRGRVSNHSDRAARRFRVAEERGTPSNSAGTRDPDRSPAGSPGGPTVGPAPASPLLEEETPSSPGTGSRKDKPVSGRAEHFVLRLTEEDRDTFASLADKLSLQNMIGNAKLLATFSELRGKTFAASETRPLSWNARALMCAEPVVIAIRSGYQPRGQAPWSRVRTIGIRPPPSGWERGNGAGCGAFQDSSTSFCRSQLRAVAPPATR